MTLSAHRPNKKDQNPEVMTYQPEPGFWTVEHRNTKKIYATVDFRGTPLEGNDDAQKKMVDELAAKVLILGGV